MNFEKMAEYEMRKKSMGVGYLFLIFLGGFGVHRFYTNQPVKGVIWILMTISTAVAMPLLLIYLLAFLIEICTYHATIRQQNRDLLTSIKNGFAYEI